VPAIIMAEKAGSNTIILIIIVIVIADTRMLIINVSVRIVVPPLTKKLEF
jgi:hypothetical protein